MQNNYYGHIDISQEKNASPAMRLTYSLKEKLKRTGLLGKGNKHKGKRRINRTRNVSVGSYKNYYVSLSIRHKKELDCKLNSNLLFSSMWYFLIFLPREGMKID